ncbi:hypothetical protein SKAU_G00121010 [Synaphobranchus kaupii]|uniref:AIG1-type G domain-containing protein n=1 Tax=Synaphobranchus kaupii TaxID=118154 RepID=A0A9Q1FP58_SYNKA|nr:hypothetical protein SKAU_G00121010 [Synaphobranchus kaupii]
MECDCKPDSACTSASICGENNELEDVVADLWINSKSVLTGTFTAVGFLLYRFSQALPFIIRWPIRLFCSLTGLSSLWSWLSRLVSTVRGLQTLVKWLSPIWKFITALPTKLGWVPTIFKAIAGSFANIKKCLEAVRKLIQHLRRKSPKIGQSRNPTTQSSPATLTSSASDTALRVILVGPRGGGRSQLGDTLLGSKGFPRASRECVSQRAFVEGREVTVVDAPDLLGSSLGAVERAREALRSIELTGPGPHAFLLVMRAPGSSGVGGGDEAGALETLLGLVGEGALSHVLPVLTHADSHGRPPTLARLLRGAGPSLRAALSLCSQRAELVCNGPSCPRAQRTALGTRLLERVEEIKMLSGHFIHELQRREDRIREQLLEDMALLLERRLEVREKEA